MTTARKADRPAAERGSGQGGLSGGKGSATGRGIASASVGPQNNQRHIAGRSATADGRRPGHRENA